MIYFDNNSTTPPLPSVLEEMGRVQSLGLGNPSSLHRGGQSARQSLEESRRRAAQTLGVHDDEIVFTASATEANNLALLGSVLRDRGRRTLFHSALEHSSIAGPARFIRDLGCPTQELPVTREGILDVPRSLELVRGHRGVVTLQLANSETGAIQPVAELSEGLDHRDLILHCDVVQALGKWRFRIADLGVDLASFSSHKIHGPLGVGALFVRRNVELSPPLRGGDQEGGRRPGTENLPGAAGFARALEETRELESRLSHFQSLRHSLISGLERIAPEIRFTLGEGQQLPNTLHFSIPGIDGQDLATAADLEGIALSTGSACHQATGKPSPVLTAMGRSEEEIRGAIRLSLGVQNTVEECELFFQKMSAVLSRFPRSRVATRADG